MNDAELLHWLYARLIEVHGEDKNVDYMLKLRAIFMGMDANICTPNIVGQMDLLDVLDDNCLVERIEQVKRRRLLMEAEGRWIDLMNNGEGL